MAIGGDFDTAIITTASIAAADTKPHILLMQQPQGSPPTVAGAQLA